MRVYPRERGGARRPHKERQAPCESIRECGGASSHDQMIRRPMREEKFDNDFNERKAGCSLISAATHRTIG